MDDFFKGQYSKTKTVSETNERLDHIGIIEKHFLIRGNQLEISQGMMEAMKHEYIKTNLKEKSLKANTLLVCYHKELFKVFHSKLYVGYKYYFSF